MARLTRQNKQVIDIIQSEPATTQTEAYQRVYGTPDRKQANERASRLMAKPEAKVYAQQVVEEAKANIARLANSAKSENVQLAANQDILDRNEGKARQTTEHVSRKLSVMIDLTNEAPKISAQEAELLEQADEL